MNKQDYVKLVSNFTEDDVHAVQPYVNNRCEERGLSYVDIVHNLLNPVNLDDIIQARAGVFKLYFRISNKRRFEIVAEVNSRRMIVRTVIMLNKKFKVKSIRRRF